MELVESGDLDTAHSEELVKKYIDPMISAGADCVVLGCTHYPFLEKVIRKVSSDRLHIFNPAPAVAKRAAQLLQKVRETSLSSATEPVGLNRRSNITIATTGCKTDVLRKLAEGVTDEVAASGLLNESEICGLRKKNFVSLDI